MTSSFDVQMHFSIYRRDLGIKYKPTKMDNPKLYNLVTKFEVCTTFGNIIHMNIIRNIF